MIGLDPITLEFLTPLPVWVAWQVQRRNARDPKPTKIPYGKHRQWAKAGVPSTWVTRSEAEAIESALEKPHGVSGIGIQMHDLKDGRRIGGVDLDTCIDPSTGEQQPWAREIVAALDSYTETSPSGTGVKVFFTYTADDLSRLRTVMSSVPGKEPWSKEFTRATGNDHPPAIEVHLGHRYFAVCVFRRKAAGDSDPFQPVIPTEASH